jgi:hypothetical protein
MSTGRQYTRERLAVAAAECVNIDEVIAYFGTPSYGGLRRYLMKRFKHFGIDVSHFPRHGHRMESARPSAADLGSAVAASVSIADTLRRLGLSDGRRTRALLRSWTTEDAISTDHFLGQAHQRGRPSPTPAKQPQDVLVKHDGRRRTKSAPLRRALRQLGVPERCDECGTGPQWLGRPMTLEIDHVDGDWSDDRVGNLRLLCPNCHAVTESWCRGSGRRGG